MGLNNFTSLNSGTFGEWQRDYLFKFIVVAEPSGDATKTWGNFATNKGKLTLSADKSDLDIYVDQAPIPNSKVAKITKRWMGQDLQFGGKLDSANTVQLTFTMDEECRIYQYLYAWKILSGTDQYAQALVKEDYIGQIALLTYKVDKETAGQGKQLNNAWVASLEDFPTKRDGNGLLTFQATIAYDFATPYPATT